jgi:transcription initiation factor TFIIIB Brf1 subunit/transcription initiation factor TFIIB
VFDDFIKQIEANRVTVYYRLNNSKSWEKKNARRRNVRRKKSSSEMLTTQLSLPKSVVKKKNK